MGQASDENLWKAVLTPTTKRLSRPWSNIHYFENDTIPEIVNGPEMGVSFEAWKSRDPKQPLKSEEKGCRDESWAIDLWWGRNFYPCLQVVANDLHARGLLEAGEYGINIDW